MQLSECINEFTIENVQLDERSLQMIEASLRQKGMTKLSLTDNQLEGAQFVVDVLKSNNSIEYLYWFGNRFRSTEDARNLFDAILEHPAITWLELGRSLNGISYSPV